MEKHFATYEQSLALKELGFDEPCLANYNNLTDKTRFIFGKTNEGCITVNKVPGTDKIVISNERILAPLKSQVFEWFRDNHQLFYNIETNCSQLSSEWGFDYTIFDKENDKWLSTEPQNCPPGETTYKTYEETESGCINKLIEMVKKK